MIDMMTSTAHIHQTTSSTCPMPNFAVLEARKLGISWKYKIKCANCPFTSPTFNLYHEIHQEGPGRNPSATNIALAYAIQDTSIGAEKIIELLTCLDIPAPSKSFMQTLLCKTSRKMTELNKLDMNDKIQKVKEVNVTRGHPENIINISTDARYNSSVMFSRKTPGQNASQAFSLAVETNTDRKYILACAVQNKLCWTGAWLRGKGMEVDCPGGHAECTANLSPAAPFSEYEMGKDIGTQLGLQDVLVRYVTTDGDAQGAKGVDDAMRALHPLWRVERLADHVHLGQSQFRASNRAVYSDEMFHSKTKEEKKELQRVFSNDLKSRCSMIVKKLFTKYDRDLEKMSSFLPKVLEATVACYDGDCSMCAAHSLVCEGGVVSNWWNFSRNLAIYRITALQMNDNDLRIVTEVLKMKLSVEAISAMKLLTDTNANESYHRSASANMPKNVKFSRTMEGRLHSMIHRRNNLPGTSTRLKCESAGVQYSDSGKRRLARIDQQFLYRQEYHKKEKIKTRRNKQQGRKMEEHHLYRQEHRTKSDYRKGQLDMNLPAARDHPYHRRGACQYHLRPRPGCD